MAHPAHPGRALPHAGGFGMARLDGLRLALALAVAASHALVLRDPGGFVLWRRLLNSEAAVQAFFMLSGALVLASYARRPDPWGFWLRRLARIMPAYLAAVVAFAGLSVGSALAAGRSVPMGELAAYLLANGLTLNFLQPGMAGVFAGNPVTAINGALWSIKVELGFYAMVPLLAWLMARFEALPVLAGMVLVGALWGPAVALLAALAGVEPHPALTHQLPGQLGFFALGIALFRVVAGLSGPGVLLGLLLLAEGALLASGQWALLGRASVLVALLALVGLAGAGRRADAKAQRGPDISFGVYLAHFPICQLLLENGALHWPLMAYLALALGLSVAWGLFSWFGIERPALAASRHAGRAQTA